MSDEKDTGLDSVLLKPLEEVMHDSMMPYAEYVILDRALPRVEDGLKPVQRRILYSMIEQGVTPDKPYRKSARIVGDCLGKYHPHGDTSVYDAMVRMAQPFNMRAQLIDGHGNYGSVDGDRAAAMRYTEARLAPLALELLRDIDKETVPFSLNYDDTRKEPDMLPGRYPNLLVNGATGIAVGLATNIPPHNLAEVIDGVIAYIDNPKITLDQMMKIIKGPDFPTGGYIATGDELELAYTTGKGKITMRAKIHIEIGDHDKRNIVITELPYQVNKAALLRKILVLKDEKKELLSGISDICDESDRSGMRAVIKIKKDADPKQILQYLFKMTDLECTYGINMVAIADGKPQLFPLLDIICYYINYQRDVIVRRTRYDLNRAKEREHILEGLIIAINNIDEVVQIIKSSSSPSDAKGKLRARFELSEKQAQAILDMRLARLTNLEVYKLESELKELKMLIERLTAILGSKKLQMEVIKDELRDIKKVYKSPRMTSIVNSVKDVQIISEDDEMPIEDFAVVYNAAQSLKKVPQKNFSMATRELSDRSTLNEIVPLLVETQNDHTIYALTNFGNCYKVDVNALPDGRWREKGNLLKTIIKDCLPDETIVKIVPVNDVLPMGDIVFFTKQGMVKRSSWEEMSVIKSNFQCIKLKDDDEVINVQNFYEDCTMLFVTESGMVLNADISDVPRQGRIAGGVKGISLGDGDSVVYAGFISMAGEIIVITDKGYMKKVLSSQLDVTARYRKGVKIIDLKGDNGSKVIFCNYVTLPYQIAMIGKDNAIYVVGSDEIPIDNRMSKGKLLKRLGKTPIDIRAVYRHYTDGEYITVKAKKKKN